MNQKKKSLTLCFWLKVCQHNIERRILSISLKDRFRNKNIRRQHRYVAQLPEQRIEYLKLGVAIEKCRKCEASQIATCRTLSYFPIKVYVILQNFLQCNQELEGLLLRAVFLQGEASFEPPFILCPPGVLLSLYSKVIPRCLSSSMLSKWLNQFSLYVLISFT